MSDTAPRAVWKFASCDGCQLTLLDCEDELLALAGARDVSYFLEASSAVGAWALRPVARRGVDHHRGRRERIPHIRRVPPLVTIGACATAGGIQALRNFAEVAEFLSVVYARPEYIPRWRPPPRSPPTSRSISNCAAAPSTVGNSSR